MDNHGNTPDQPANNQAQSPKPRIAKGHGDAAYVSTTDQAILGGGSTSLHRPDNVRMAKAFNPTFVSAPELQSAAPLDSWLVEQKENQDCMEMGRKDNGNLDGTSSKL